MKKLVIYLLGGITFLLTSCSWQNEDRLFASKQLTKSFEAVNPYFTSDQDGNAVLCWTEKSGNDSLYRLRYSVYDPKARAFGEAVTVGPSAGTSAVPESMNKIAFKKDGTTIAVFSTKFPNEKNPYAGAILYSLSGDKGKTWSKPEYLHSDTSHAYGRSFFDIANLANGEIAAVWLDGRFAKESEGSALFFANTTDGKGFGHDTCLARNTCECCRTDLYSDKSGSLHLAYRSISYPKSQMGKQVRDMVYSFSGDNGKSFTEARAISNDNWAIKGCPHTGPTLASDDKGIQAVWFTAGGNSGLYNSQAPSGGSAFSPRTIVSRNGRHPQMKELGDGSVAIAWDETRQNDKVTAGQKNHSGHGHSGSLSSPTKIVLQIREGGANLRTFEFGHGNANNHHPVIATVGSAVLVAWVQEDNNGANIAYSYIEP